MSTSHQPATALLQSDTSPYPANLHHRLGKRAPQQIGVLGNLDLLSRPGLALFSSVSCPGQLILGAHDLAEQLAEAGTPVIGGFHGPVEQECLTVLLRGRGPVVICLARGLEGMRLRREWKELLGQGRLLVLSPFAGSLRRPTAETAYQRNLCAAALASAVFIVYAKPGGKTEQFCREVVAWGKPVYTFQGQLTANLVSLGAQALEIAEIVASVSSNSPLITKRGGSGPWHRAGRPT
jgi:predicted Rossmann fold nucleotide-binding protein DprA/Smf involved in DNA uptake